MSASIPETAKKKKPAPLLALVPTPGTDGVRGAGAGVGEIVGCPETGVGVCIAAWTGVAGVGASVGIAGAIVFVGVWVTCGTVVVPVWVTGMGVGVPARVTGGTVVVPVWVTGAGVG